MALIQCPECKKEVSDQAKICVHCGYPLEKSSEKQTIPEETENAMESRAPNERKPINKRKLSIIVAAILISAVLIGLGIYFILDNQKYSRDLSQVIGLNFGMTKADVIEYERTVYGNTDYRFDEEVNRLDFELYFKDNKEQKCHLYFFDHETDLLDAATYTNNFDTPSHCYHVDYLKGLLYSYAGGWDQVDGSLSIVYGSINGCRCKILVYPDLVSINKIDPNAKSGRQ